MEDLLLFFSMGRLCQDLLAAPNSGIFFRSLWLRNIEDSGCVWQELKRRRRRQTRARRV